MKGPVAHLVALALAGDGARQACAMDADAVDAAARDPAVAGAHAGADLVVPVWAPLAWAHATSPVTCTEVFWGLAAASASLGLRLFFLGAPLGAPARAERVARFRVPGVRVVGTYAAEPQRIGSHRERARIVSIVRAAAPDVLVVGFGDVHEDVWLAANRDALGVPVAIGLRRVFTGEPRRPRAWPRATSSVARALLSARVRA